MIYDKLNSYIPAFFIAGASPIVGACILCLIRTAKSNDEDDDVFLEQSTNLLTGTTGSETSDDHDMGNTRRNGYATVDYEYEPARPKKKRPSFYLGNDPEDEKGKSKAEKPKGSFMYSPEPFPEVEKILYSALKENPTNPKRPRLPSNRTSNVSFHDLPYSLEEESTPEPTPKPTPDPTPTEEVKYTEPTFTEPKPKDPHFEPKLHETYSYTSKHTIV